MSAVDSIFAESRKLAASKLHVLQTPTNEQENYRFSPKSKQLWEQTSPAAVVSLEAPELEEGELALLFVSGVSEERQGNVEAIFQSLASVTTLPKDLALASCFETDKYAQFSLSHWQNGIFLRVAAGKKVELPIRALQELRGEQATFRTIIILEEGACANLVDEYIGDANSVTGILEFRLAKNSSLKYSQVQRLSSRSQFFFRQDIQLAEGAKFEYTPLYLGAASGQLRSQTFLNGSEAVFSVSGAARGSQSQHFDFWMDVTHLVPDTTSGIDFWFVMDDQSRAVFNGLVHIGKNASGTDAYQKCKTLLLSDKAQVNALPKLIIQTDAVKCAHGASIASVQPEQVHYLQSRGISEREARRMIVRGFTAPVVDRLPTSSLHERIEAMISQKENI